MDLTKLLEWSTSRERNLRIINSSLNDVSELEVTQIHSLCNLFHWDATLFDKVVDLIEDLLVLLFDLSLLRFSF